MTFDFQRDNFGDWQSCLFELNKIAFYCLGETLAERGLLRIVTFCKNFRSLVKTSRNVSEKNAADLSRLQSLWTEETFEEKIDNVSE